ncbi:hypothetical protein ACH4VR_36235 [Streptomyces sp. NPDC020883]|uniref:hypothetical protein n=1 Tax=Streptomyces sp. NPDC020883 TaxID=3365099 RepID=UPI00379F1845
MFRKPQLPSYGLYAENDGMTRGWPEFVNLKSEDSVLTQLAQFRSELAATDAAFAVHSSYIHLLRHNAPNCDCLTNEQPGDNCTIVKTVAPNPEATEEQDQEAAAAWMADRVAAAGLDPMDLDDLVHDTATAEASDVNNDGISAQAAFLLRQFGQEEAMKLVAQVVDDLASND